ncbi:murein hydrolase activator EnvC family protein [Pseudomarimonas salicorniae]|uniref:Peptidoglycan DD-metalloendopeptidase family protein n=1 Tax=Pseudomarimonas salicorniae TaxID=2933270 RepID=A0ABT0GCL2_9GAMM|nr:peptidoglycan DD-metalloendopeptidase family protein [Lysobacter sp. CAU 1642]MCK7592256.1 peptidoglycan DD-metalloendopeptidase family protein [Lysobacter sp. CAU 1642]
MQRSRAPRHLAWLLLALPMLAPAAGEREAEVSEKLARVRAELKQLAESQRQLEGQRAAEVEALRAADREIGERRRTLDAAQADLARQQAALDALQTERDEAASRLERERQALAALVRALHAAGREEPLKQLLAQDSVDAVSRAMVYQRYLQQDRRARAEALIGTLKVLADAEAALEQQRAIAARTEADQQAALEALQTQRAERERLIAGIDRRFRDARERQRVLGRDESQLASLLDSLKDVFADIPDDLGKTLAISGLKGRLPRPLSGPLRSAYAGTLPDGRASKGWWIEAEAGTRVTAIAHGRVAFADWMRGYGLLLILDHGEGFMSLYAGGDALLAEPGDWIEAGQPVASAGSSGGFAASGLYFELRRGGQALDPAAWLRR